MADEEVAGHVVDNGSGIGTDCAEITNSAFEPAVGGPDLVKKRLKDVGGEGGESEGPPSVHEELKKQGGWIDKANLKHLLTGIMGPLVACGASAMWFLTHVMNIKDPQMLYAAEHGINMTLKFNRSSWDEWVQYTYCPHFASGTSELLRNNTQDNFADLCWRYATTNASAV